MVFDFVFSWFSVDTEKDILQQKVTCTRLLCYMTSLASQWEYFPLLYDCCCFKSIKKVNKFFDPQYKIKIG